jgi:hypothetical protein
MPQRAGRILKASCSGAAAAAGCWAAATPASFFLQVTKIFTGEGSQGTRSDRNFGQQQLQNRDFYLPIEWHYDIMFVANYATS